MGAYDQAIATGQRALALATASGNVVLHAQANACLGYAYRAQGDYRRAIDSLGQTVVSLEGARRRELFGQVFLPAVNARAWLAVCHAELGMFAEGSAFGEEGLRIAEAVDHPASPMLASWGIGLLSLRQGDLRRALPLLERAVGLCQDADLPVWFPLMAPALGAAAHCHRGLGMLYLKLGRGAQARPELPAAIALYRAMDMTFWLPQSEAAQVNAAG
jgi:tetratricopeptide (TPR) repeat protein